MEPMLEIALVAFGLTTVSNLIQNKFMDKAKMKKMQKGMKTKQKRLKNLQEKYDDNHPELEKLQKEMMTEMNDMMKGSMKSMVVVMGVVLPVFYFLHQHYGDLQVVVPFLGSIEWIWWYVMVAVVFGLIISKVMEKIQAK